MEPAVSSPAKLDDRPQKQVKVNVLRCRNESCKGLLAFEETDEGYLLGQVLELADVDGEQRFFPCPKCGGRLLVEEYVHRDGKLRVRVCGFLPAR
jgi:hypothetical protein